MKYDCNLDGLVMTRHLHCEAVHDAHVPHYNSASSFLTLLNVELTTVVVKLQPDIHSQCCIVYQGNVLLKAPIGMLLSS